ERIVQVRIWERNANATCTALVAAQYLKVSRERRDAECPWVHPTEDISACALYRPSAALQPPSLRFRRQRRASSRKRIPTHSPVRTSASGRPSRSEIAKTMGSRLASIVVASIRAQ